MNEVSSVVRKFFKFVFPALIYQIHAALFAQRAGDQLQVLVAAPISERGEPMSVARPNGTKILLPRSGPDQFWQLVHDHFAGEDARKWKYLAMLALRENAGWPLDRIGNVFGHPKGHVTRCLARIKSELRKDFEASPEFLDLDDELSWELEATSSGSLTDDFDSEMDDLLGSRPLAPPPAARAEKSV